MTTPSSIAPTGNNLIVDKTNPPAGPAGNNSVVDKANPFVGLNVSGFAPIGVILAERKERAGELKKKSGPQPPTVSEHRTPLGPGESLYDGRIDETRLYNIAGGWVKRTT
jgi:hypothetical protein